METLDYQIHRKEQLQDLTQRYKFMMSTMLVVLAGTFYQIYKNIQMQSIIKSMQEGDITVGSQFTRLNSTDMVSMVILLISIANVVAVCMFLYTAASNVYGYYNNQLKYSPGWTIGWFFIPIVNAVMPLLTLAQLSKASGAMFAEKETDEIQHQKIHPAMLVWIICWITNIVLAIFMTVYIFKTTFDLISSGESQLVAGLMAQGKVMTLSIISTSLNIINGIALLIFASKITKETSRIMQ